MHIPYENRLKHKADFRVKYTFRNPEYGGNPSALPYQGLRCDYSYAEPQGPNVFMIWPEFEDESGNILIATDQPVPLSGTAGMWIINKAMRPLHYDRIKVGVKGHFVKGGIIADCEVIEIVGLNTNPVESLN